MWQSQLKTTPDNPLLARNRSPPRALMRAVARGASAACSACALSACATRAAAGRAGAGARASSTTHFDIAGRLSAQARQRRRRRALRVAPRAAARRVDVSYAARADDRPHASRRRRRAASSAPAQPDGEYPSVGRRSRRRRSAWPIPVDGLVGVDRGRRRPGMRASASSATPQERPRDPARAAAGRSSTRMPKARRRSVRRGW